MRSVSSRARVSCTTLGYDVQRLWRSRPAIPTPRGSHNTAQGRRRRTLGLGIDTDRTPTGFHNRSALSCQTRSTRTNASGSRQRMSRRPESARVRVTASVAHQGPPLTQVPQGGPRLRSRTEAKPSINIDLS